MPELGDRSPPLKSPPCPSTSCPTPANPTSWSAGATARTCSTESTSARHVPPDAGLPRHALGGCRTDRGRWPGRLQPAAHRALRDRCVRLHRWAPPRLVL